MIPLERISYKRVKLRFEEKGYAFFTKPYDLNIFGVRSDNKIGGSFDDLVGIAYTDNSNTERLFLAEATTDPSDKWLFKPLHPKGTAIMLPGQYRRAYKIGIHGRTWASGGYKALEQINLMRYVRDNNQDNVLDIHGAPFLDNLKTNIHRASKWEIVDKIGSYSAGCQVIQDPVDFELFISLCEDQVSHGLGNKFTYTLLEQYDF
jgi:hypothetical protein